MPVMVDRHGKEAKIHLPSCRLKVTALVRNASAAQTAYGDYVKPVSGSIGESPLQLISLVL